MWISPLIRKGHSLMLVSTSVSEAGDMTIRCPECEEWFTILEATEDSSVTCSHCDYLFYPITDCTNRKTGEPGFAPVTDFIRAKERC